MRLERIKIMVVDDDPDIRELMTLALESEGAVVSQAVDGNDAINVFKRIQTIIELKGSSPSSACSRSICL